MAVTIEHTSDVAAVLTVAVSQADYQPKVTQMLKNFQQRADIPGFRRGKAPMGMINKKYAAGAKVDAINELVASELYKYIQDSGLKIIAEPMPMVDLEKPIDMENGTDYEFLFEVALRPKLEAQFGKEDQFTYYTIEADEAIVDNHIQQMLAQAGSHEEADSVEENDLVRGVLAELEGGQPREGGARNENAILLPRYIKDKEVEAQFVGAAKNSVVVFEPFKAYEGNKAELTSFLGVEKDAVAGFEGVQFSFEIQSIQRHVPAQLNEEFFTNVFGLEGDIKTEADLRQNIRESLREQFDPESDYKLYVDIRAALKDKLAGVKYAESVLTSFLARQNNISIEEATAQLPDALNGLSEQLYIDETLEKAGVEISADDVRAFARIFAKNQFAQYGMSSVPDEMLDRYADDLMKKNDMSQRFFEQVRSNKFVGIIKEQVTLIEETVSPEQFGKIVNPEA